MIGMEVAAVGMVTGWGESAAALPPDAVRAAAGRRLIAARRSMATGERFRRATRECLLGIGALVAGVVISQIALSVAGFVVMLGCAWLAYASWRRIPAPGEIVPVARRKVRAVAKPGGRGSAGRQPRQPTMRRFEERWQRRRDEGNL